MFLDLAIIIIKNRNQIIGKRLKIDLEIFRNKFKYQYKINLK